ncbi:MAG TPA: caspase family protein [Panacibacter sp.]|nr:caspase family protein [Panacibacter sp.]
MLPVGHTDRVMSAEFSPDGKTIVTISADGTAKLWETSSGKLLINFLEGGDASMATVSSALFSPDGKKIVISYETSHSKIVDLTSEKVIWDWLYNDHDLPVKDVMNHFSPDGKRIIFFEPRYEDSTISYNTPTIYNLETAKPVFTLKGGNTQIYKASYSPDGKKIVTASSDSTVKIWDALTAKPLITIPGQNEVINSITFSSDSKRIFVVTEINTVKILDAVTGKKITQLQIHETQPGETYFYFRPDGKRLITLKGNYDDNYTGFILYDSLSFWDTQKGKEFFKTGCHILANKNNFFSPDQKKFIIINNDSTVAVRNAEDGKIIYRLTGFIGMVNSAVFSPDGKMIITACDDSTVKVWDADNGNLLYDLKGKTDKVLFAKFSPDEKKIVTAHESNIAKVWDAVTGKKIIQLAGRSNNILKANYNSDGSKIIITLAQCKQIWDINRVNVLFEPGIKKNSSPDEGLQYNQIEQYSSDSSNNLSWAADYLTVSSDGITMTLRLWSEIKYAQFSPDNKKLLVTLYDNTIRILDVKKIISAHHNIAFDTDFSELTFISIDSTDYLITDAQSHYDGTEAARKLLYFTCGDEVIELDQVKDQLWVPNLAERINKGETINAKTLNELNICGLTPQVEDKSTNDEFYFTITPRRGGLGETVLLVNGIEAKRYKQENLSKNKSGYELVIKKETLKDLFIAGKQNPVTVKAYTSDNTVSSRGAVVEVDESKNTIAPPNLYSVMIGVSDYKGNDLDLKYAAKDATDISAAVSNAAKKLLNTGDSNHVFTYNLTTNASHYLLPEKNSIKKTLQEIGLKATANDILLIFFAGHGVMAGEADKKQFYFLSADASNLSTTDAVKDVGISTAELADWMKPQNIKAQKRILIFDACQSGQAINDFVKLGNDDQQFVAARNDDRSQQIKAIDKLNEKSGLFILSASASTQSAYEMGRYSQGLLTYSLLKAIKQQPDILDQGKYLDVSRWFDAAGKTVSDIAKENGAIQDPQIVSNTNFNIGLVDEEVMAKIILPQEKPLFAASNFQNSDEAIADDDIELSKLINLQLNDLAARGTESKIVYVTATNSPDAYSMSGRYTIKENTITVTVNIKQNKAIKSKFELTGTKDKPADLAALIAAKAAEWAANNK